MTARSTPILTALVAILLACQAAASAAYAGDEAGAAPTDPANTVPLREALDAVRAQGGFEAPSAATVDDAQQVFAALLADELPVEDIAAVGLVRRRVTLSEAAGLAVADPVTDVEGRGFYLIRDRRVADAPVFLQAPHRFKDLDTGAIAAALAVTGAFRMSAWNTVPRWAPNDRSDRRADLAHRDVSHFNAATAAFAAAHPDGVVVQLHGFAVGKRRTSAGRSADVIVSSGRRSLSGPAEHVRDCLRSRLSVVVRGYGDDVHELGATTNRNAAMLRAQGFKRFVHVELARALRRSLLEDAAQRARLRQCLTEIAR